MRITPQITLRNMEPSDAVKARIEDRLARLDRFHDRIMACRVVVQSPHRHSHKGKLYNIRVDLTVPGDEIVVNREPDARHAHEDVYVAIRDTFNAVQRQLEDHARKRSGHLAKAHPTPVHGRVVRLFADEGYGFIAMTDGHEVYFQENSVTGGGWDLIDIGTEVRFIEIDGESGAHALAVTPID